MDKITKIKGFLDYLPDECERIRRLEDWARTVFGRFGFREIRPPVLEKTELFARGIGEATDVVQKEMYTFQDRKGRSTTMRPEATAGIVRAYVENTMHAREPYSKLFTIGPMFRYERPQKGRLRQFHQINAECLGLSDPLTDAETIALCMEFLGGLNLGPLRLEINSLGCQACRPDYHAKLAAHLTSLDASELCEDCTRRVAVNPLRLLDCKTPRCKELTAGAPAMAEHLCTACDDHHKAVIGFLDALGVAYTPNPRLVRGLDYYVRTTFEVVSENIGAQSAVGGGGRYDGLVQSLGGPDTPAIGFACGVERLLLLMGETEPRRPDFYIAVLDPKAQSACLLLADRLRRAGLTGELASEMKSFKSQLRTADRLKSRFALLVGESEFAAGQVAVKNLADGVQTLFPLGDVAALVAALTS